MDNLGEHMASLPVCGPALSRAAGRVAWHLTAVVTGGCWSVGPGLHTHADGQANRTRLPRGVGASYQGG